MKYEVAYLYSYDRGREFSTPVLLPDGDILCVSPRVSHHGKESLELSSLQGGKLRRIGDLPGYLPNVQCRLCEEGRVIGSFLDTRKRSKMFLWEKGKTTIYDVPATITNMLVQDVNARRQVVGAYATGSTKEGNPAPFLFDPARGFIRLPISTEGTASRINDVGTIAGVAAARNGKQGLTFVIENGKVHWISAPNSDLTAPVGITSNGLVVGTADTKQGIQCPNFIYRNGRCIYSKPSSAEYVAVNTQGQIVGTGSGSPENRYGCLWDAGIAYDVNSVTKP